MANNKHEFQSLGKISLTADGFFKINKFILVDDIVIVCRNHFGWSCASCQQENINITEGTNNPCSWMISRPSKTYNFRFQKICLSNMIIVKKIPRMRKPAVKPDRSVPYG